MDQITLQNFTVHPREGLNKTLSLLSLLEDKSLSNPQFIKFVHENFYSECAPCVPGKIWNYMRNNFIYVSDDPFDEKITAPYLMKDLKEGDCDDFSLFAKTCIDILGGYNSYYILLGKEVNKWSHVAVYLNRGISGNKAIDPLVIDGTNPTFNKISDRYKFYQLV